MLPFQEELDLTAVHKKAMFELPPEKKWQLYLSKKKVRWDGFSSFFLLSFETCWFTAWYWRTPYLHSINSPMLNIYDAYIRLGAWKLCKDLIITYKHGSRLPFFFPIFLFALMLKFKLTFWMDIQKQQSWGNFKWFLVMIPQEVVNH